MIIFCADFVMGRGKDISVEARAKICALLDASNLTQREIANAVGVSKSVVGDIAKKNASLMPIGPSRVGNCGRKRCTTKREDKEDC